MWQRQYNKTEINSRIHSNHPLSISTHIYYENDHEKTRTFVLIWIEEKRIGVISYFSWHSVIIKQSLCGLAESDSSSQNTDICYHSSSTGNDVSPSCQWDWLYLQGQNIQCTCFSLEYLVNKRPNTVDHCPPNPPTPTHPRLDRSHSSSDLSSRVQWALIGKHE